MGAFVLNLFGFAPRVGSFVARFSPKIGSIVTDMLGELTAWVTGLITLLLTILSSIVDIFYDGTTEKLTVYGVLAMFGLAWALIKFGIGFISSMIRK